MRAKDILTEATINPEIVAILKGKGYTQLGKGQDQIAFVEPGTGMVLKIFGTSSKGSQSPQLTMAQNSFKVFADYCAANPDNPFLPQVSGWETFVFDGFVYLQIRIERMFPLPRGDIGDILEAMSDFTDDGISTPAKRERFVNNMLDRSYGGTAEELFTLLGDEIDLLWDTLYDVSRLAQKHNYVLDLHEANFMLGSDGHIVISDPFFIGWGKS